MDTSPEPVAQTPRQAAMTNGKLVGVKQFVNSALAYQIFVNSETLCCFWSRLLIGNVKEKTILNSFDTQCL